MTRIDIKMMHSTELREIRSMIRDELDFRADTEKEINERQEQNWADEADVRPIYNDAQMLNGTFEGDSISKIKNKRRPDQMKFELHGPGPDEEK